MAPTKGYRIGEIASLTGLTPDALRFYERRGLLEAPARSQGRFRIYAATAVDRIHFIKRAQALGFSLNEIHEARPLQWQRWAASVLPCSGAAPRDRLGELETKLAELAALQETLKATLKQCERAISTKNESACPVIEFATEKDGVT